MRLSWMLFHSGRSVKAFVLDTQEVLMMKVVACAVQRRNAASHLPGWIRLKQAMQHVLLSGHLQQLHRGRPAAVVPDHASSATTLCVGTQQFARR